jgi:hypothetical protein
MFCPKCGSESSDDSQFCRKCGNALAATVPSSLPVTVDPAREKTKAVRPAFIVTVLLMLALFGWYVDHAVHTRPVTPPSTSGNAVESAPVPQPQLHTVKIGNGALSVAAMHYTFYTLPVPVGARNVKVQGHFEATGGTGNDIEVFLLSEEQFTNWKNRHSTPTYYNSGKLTVGDLQAALPDDAGTYYLVFNNNFSLLTAKAVQFNGTMDYYQ